MPRVCNEDINTAEAVPLQHPALNSDVAKGKSYDFYFSYDVDVFCQEARQGRQRVKRLCDFLCLHGFTIWTSECQIQIHPDKYHNITTGLESSTVFVVCLSGKFVSRCSDIDKSAQDTSLFEIRYSTDRFRGSRRVVLAFDIFSMSRNNWAGLLGGDVGGTEIVDFTSDDQIPLVAAFLGKALWHSVPSGVRNDFSIFPTAPTSTVALGSAASRKQLHCFAGDSVRIRTSTGGIFRGWISEESSDAGLVVILSEAVVGEVSPATPTRPQTFVLPPPPPPPAPPLPAPSVSIMSLLDSAQFSRSADSPHNGGGPWAPPPVSGSPTRLALGQDSSRLPRMNGLTAAHFAVGEPVSVRRGDGRRTVGEVEDVSQAGVVKVRCGPDQVKTVPEQELGKLRGSYTF